MMAITINLEGFDLFPKQRRGKITRAPPPISFKESIRGKGVDVRRSRLQVEEFGDIEIRVANK